MGLNEERIANGLTGVLVMVFWSFGFNKSPNIWEGVATFVAVTVPTYNEPNTGNAAAVLTDNRTAPK